MIETCAKCGFAHDIAVTCLTARVIREREKRNKHLENYGTVGKLPVMPSEDEMVALAAGVSRREAIKARTIKPTFKPKEWSKRKAQRKQARKSRSRNRRSK